MLRNELLSETELIEVAEAQLRGSLPSAWSLSVFAGVDSEGRPNSDTTFSLTGPDGARSSVLVEVKRQFEGRDVQRVARRLRETLKAQRGPTSALIVAPFISSRGRQLLQNEAIGYIDATGNMWLALTRPGLFIRTDGATSSPWRESDRPLRSLKGRAAGRAIRAFVDVKPPYGVRELAERSATPAATLSRVSDLLAREALIARDGTRGKIIGVDWAGVVRRWAADYSFADANRTRSYLDPRGMRSVLNTLRNARFAYAVTGSIAANSLAPLTESRLATLYVVDLASAARALNLRPAETGANVILAEPFDSVVFERTRVADGLTYVSASQTAVDSLTGPGRSPSEGEAVLAWMQAHEEQWRV